MNAQTLSEALQHLVLVLFFADLYLTLFAGLVWGLVYLRRNASFDKFRTANARASDPALEKALDEIIAARLPTLAGK